MKLFAEFPTPLNAAARRAKPVIVAYPSNDHIAADQVLYQRARRQLTLVARS